MVGYPDSSGKTVLWDEPSRPAGLLKVPSQVKGRYSLGQSYFHTKDVPLTSIFRRQIAGGAEEFLLGFISVLIIALLSEIVQAILMHTKRNRNGRTTKKGVRVAFLVDEFYHFRNVFAHLFGRSSRTRIAADGRSRRRSRTYTSLIVLCIASALMAADVFAVYLTQPTHVLSGEREYNLRGFQPIEPDRNSAKFFRRVSKERPCVTPPFTESNQDRTFSVSTCVFSNITEGRTDPEDTISSVTVRSFMHFAGSDHTITFGESSDAAKITVSVRTYLYVYDGKGTMVRFTFSTDADNEYFRFLHNLFIYSVFETNCNREGTAKSCDELVDQLDGDGVVEEREVTDDILMWHERKKVRMQNVKGYETTFNVEIDDPFYSIIDGLYPLTITAMIEEVEYPGTYQNITDESAIEGLAGLLNEEARLGGLVLFVSIFAIFSIVLLVLRLTLRPSSLGSMAWKARKELGSLESESSSDRKAPNSHDGSSLCFDYETSLNIDRDDRLSSSIQITDAEVSQDQPKSLATSVSADRRDSLEPKSSRVQGTQDENDSDSDTEV